MWLTSFSWGQALLRSTEPLMDFRTLPLPPDGSTRGFFSYIYLEDLVELLAVNLTLLFNSGFPIKAWFPWQFSLVSKLWLSAFTCPSLQSWGQWFDLCPPLSYRFKQSYWFFSIPSFLLIRTDWWLPRSLSAELGTWSPFMVFAVMLSLSEIHIPICSWGMPHLSALAWSSFSLRFTLTYLILNLLPSLPQQET